MKAVLVKEILPSSADYIFARGGFVIRHLAAGLQIQRERSVPTDHQCLRQQVSRWGQKRQADSTCLAV
jgi:hypothetical protein